MDGKALRYLAAMGIQAWTERRPAAMPVELDEPRSVGTPAPMPTPMPVSTPASKPLPEAASMPPATSDWEELEAQVRTCTRCPLHLTRRNAVFGTGNREADWMIIGEAPGAEEDRQGEPFVGRAGKLLDEMLAALGLPREAVYIANVLKSRPPGNRDPNPDEVAACEPYLKRQVALVRPKIILAVGRIAAQNLLKTDTRIGALRGRVHRYADIPLVATYHPAYLLRSPLEKRKAWEDLRLAARLLADRH